MLSKHCTNDPHVFYPCRQTDPFVVYVFQCREMAIPEVEACIKATKILAFLNKPLRAGEFIQNAIYTSLEITNAERITKWEVAQVIQYKLFNLFCMRGGRYLIYLGTCLKGLH